jgi:hypothetical protein
MTERYVAQEVFLNTSKRYRQHFKKRGVAFIRHYGTVEMVYPTPDQLAHIAMLTHTWKIGDRFFKLAQENYQDPRYWWVIAWLNKTPTEAHLEHGDQIMVPLDLDVFLEIIGI